MEMCERGVTNFVWRLDDSTAVKYFSPTRWTIVTANLFKTFFLDFRFFQGNESIKREIDAKKRLEDIGIKVPKILDHTEKTIKMEYIDGRDLRSLLENSRPERCFELGRRKGRQLRKIHLFDYALIDSRLSNTVVQDDCLYSIDHELFTEHPSRAHKEFDLITLETSARFMKPEKYRKFIDGFKTGYGDKFRNHDFIRMFLTGCTGIGFSIFGEKSVRSFFNGLRNWMEDITRKIF